MGGVDGRMEDVRTVRDGEVTLTATASRGVTTGGAGASLALRARVVTVTVGAAACEEGGEPGMITASAGRAVAADTRLSLTVTGDTTGDTTAVDVPGTLTIGRGMVTGTAAFRTRLKRGVGSSTRAGGMGRRRAEVQGGAIVSAGDRTMSGWETVVEDRGHTSGRDMLQRSGSTRQKPSGAALSRFLLRKQGLHWDGVPVPHARLEDLSEAAVDRFRDEARRSGRLDCRAARRTDAGPRRQAAPAGEVAPEAGRPCCCSTPTRRSSSRART